MSAPFLKKEKDGFSVRLHRSLYSADAINAVEGVAVSNSGAYWSVKFTDVDEAQVLNALDQLLLLSKGQRP
jgi:hypothetical protein